MSGSFIPLARSVQIWENARVATMAADGPAPYGMIDDGVVAVRDGRIAWVGRRQDLPSELRGDAETHDAEGGLLTPGLIDCHTHLVYGGNRATEFEARLNGATYEDIARAGGGIISTVNATRAADEGQLFAQSRRRLRALLAEGVTTIEIKSGYGLSAEAEAKCLRVARQLGETEAVSVRTTFLGAHALPPEFAGRADDYIAEVCRMLPQLHAQGLVDAVDAFCETIAFSPAQTRRVFEAAHALGLPVKLHAEQLSDSAGAELAATYGALSCDHLEWLSQDGARAMARAGSVAVLLPGAFYFLRETRVPPIDLLRQHSLPIAVSTDCNPGTSPCTSLLLMLNMACTLFRLTPQEALAGVTRNAAKALGLADRGVLAAGLRADFIVWDAASPAELCYALGANPRRATFIEGLPT
jgi:imidazolonepropionase